jgi:heme O synthase-like polyprenyltransferase
MTSQTRSPFHHRHRTPSSRFAQFYALTKPRVVQLIVFA